MKIEIDTHKELLAFLDKDKLNIDLANRVANAYLDTYGYVNDLKLLRKKVKDYIDKYGNDIERPLFYD